MRRSKSRYKILEADEQDSLELQPQRAGEMFLQLTSLDTIVRDHGFYSVLCPSFISSQDAKGWVVFTILNKNFIVQCFIFFFIMSSCHYINLDNKID